MKGAKGVLFVTGECQFPQFCNWYCPLSANRRGVNRSFIDELELEQGTGDETVIRELELIDANGVSFTGGDPLLNKRTQNLTLHYLHLVKEHFGSHFHAHLYTNGITLTEQLLEKLSRAGLDEIRLHPSPEISKKIPLLTKSGIKSIGLEIPAIPTESYAKYLFDLIPRLDQWNLDFLNLNELEYTETNADGLNERGFVYDWETLASVQGMEVWINLLFDHLVAQDLRIAIHYCPISLKDGVQLRNRYRRRAYNVAQPFEEVTPDGLLVAGIISGKLETLLQIREYLRYNMKIPESIIYLDDYQEVLKIPWNLLEEEKLLYFLAENPVKAGIQEILPLDSRDVCEFTPVDLRRGR